MSKLIGVILLLGFVRPAAEAAAPKLVGGAVSIERQKAHDEFAFLGWDPACSAAVQRVSFPPFGEGMLGEPKAWEFGSLAIAPGASRPKANWIYDSRKDAFWSASQAKKASETLTKTHAVKGFSEDVRDGPVGDQPGLAELLTTTSSFKSAGSPNWPPDSFRLSEVHYHPLITCALLVFSTRGSPEEADYRFVLIRLLNTNARRRRTDAHAANGLLLYSKAFDPEAAEAELAIAARMDPQYAPGRYHHAVMLAALGRFDEALEELAAAVRLDKSWSKKAKEALEFDSLRDDERFLDIVKS